MKFHSRFFQSLLICSLLLCSLSAEAQNLGSFNDNLLNSLGEQLQTNAKNANNASSQLDNARNRQTTNNVNNDRIINNQNQIPAPTRIEKDYLKRLKAVYFDNFEKNTNKANSSAQEENLNNKDANNPESYSEETLKQFGYDLFDGSQDGEQNFGALFNSVRDSYVLGIGDELILTYRGQKSETETVKVNTEGQIFLEDFSPFVALGRKFADVKNQIKDLVANNMVKTDVFVSLGSVKDLSVVVSGEVEKAGVYTLSGVANLFDALLKSGGIKKTGSLRNINIIRKGRTINLDLYNLLLGKGDVKDVALADGDRIVVPTIGKTVAVLGDVNRPAIYELKQDEIKQDDALDYAGGTLRGTSSGYRYVTISGKENGLDVVKEQKSASYTMKASDILIVMRTRDKQTEAVFLEGHVNVPGVRSLSASSNISSIINDVEIFKDNPYLLFGLVQRRDPATLSRFFIPVNFLQVLNGSEDFSLEDGDRIIVFGRDDIKWLTSKDVQDVLNKETLESKNPCLNRLISAVSSGWTDRFTAATQINSKNAIKKEDKENLRNTSRNNSDNYDDDNYNNNQNNRNNLNSQRTDNSDFANKTDEEVYFCPAIFEKYLDVLPFILTNVVNVNGEVNLVGIYPVVGKAPVSSLVTVCGGLSPNADLSAIEITRFSNREASERDVINANKQPLTEVFVSANDYIRFNQTFTDRESGHINLVGEFKRPGFYSIKKGEKLSDVINRAGGLTDEAYPIGSVFTRESVRQAEYQMIQIAVNNMQSGFMHSMASMELKNISPNAVVSMMSELKNLMSDTEPLGRIVVEADPLKLQLSPELDMILEAGDNVYMPKRPNHVLVSGEVLHSGALQFISGRSPREYIKLAGGTTQSADKSRTFMVLPNGTAKPVSLSSWNLGKVNVPPGSTILVPRDTAPANFMIFTKDILDIVSKAAVTAASIKVLNDD
ncbi:MAG: SLBB domain-containing protein [Alphaproteobacteria bacterium]